MDSFDFLKLFGSIRDEYILSAQATPEKKHFPAKRVLLIAAVISLLLILVGCAVVALLGLKDAQLGRYEYDMGFGYTQSGDTISLQGFAGSPEYQAAQEWKDFCQSYDSDGTILAAIGNQPTGLDTKYQFYSAYTQEMAEELDRICGKYGLALHTQMDILQGQEDLLQRVGGVFLTGYYNLGGYIYDDGTFGLDGDALVDGELIGFQFRRSVKGSFDDVYLNVWDIAQYQESHITAPTGDDLLLAVSPKKGLILADLGDCFISVNVLCGEGQTITEELLQKIAAGFDFFILKNVVKPEMEELFPTEAPETLPPVEGSDAQRKAYRDALQFLYTNYALPGGYEVGYDGISELSDNKFAIYDVDGDSSQELIIQYSTTSIAGNTCAIYDYDEATDSVKEELLEYISVSVQDNGYLIADASHAHGLGSGGILWPYTLYWYEPATDTYEQVARVDTWEKQYYPQDFDGNPFPDAVDQDGDGVVYLLYFPDTQAPQILDEAAFREWESAYRTEDVSLPWVSMTLLNIDALVQEENSLPHVSVDGTAYFGERVKLDIAVVGVSSDNAGYRELLEQNPDTPTPGENQEYIVISMVVTYQEGELDCIDFCESPATLYDGRLLFHLPGESGNSTDVTHLLKNSIWGQTLFPGNRIRGDVAFLQEKGNTQPLYFVGFGQTVALKVQ